MGSAISTFSVVPLRRLLKGVRGVSRYDFLSTLVVLYWQVRLPVLQIVSRRLLVDTAICNGADRSRDSAVDLLILSTDLWLVLSELLLRTNSNSKNRNTSILSVFQ
jgi:hypothetical protein